MFYVTSDQHFNHANIIKYCNRPFNTVAEMNKELIDGWNKVVEKDDIIYCLGDFALCNRENIKDFVSQLNGYKILIMGNHDHLHKNIYLGAGFNEVYKEEEVVEYNNKLIKLSHHKHKDLDDRYCINIYGHVHDKPEDDEKHICACVELWDYKPVSIDVLLEKGEKL